MTDRNEDQGAKAGEPLPDDLDCPGTPMIDRAHSEAHEDDNDYLPLPPIICRGIGAWREDQPSLWVRLRRWRRWLSG